ncbi:hypothetical protein VIGAN_11136000 [Vigna angularis var. angularis]|uniref:Cytochrome P450 n=1 Tax=Vigna angularis var. angularis TaxID=157739 RepID=A0A0S3TAK3_PHAAN|nr:cytochrome P450 82A4 [Vigna angularis]BAU01969.1 hypothetical protein VIGAN_11136000 [Vigna angularis var. angularis]
MESLQTALSPLTVAVLVLIPPFLYLFLVLHRTRIKEPPTIPGAWPIIGHLPLLARSPATHYLLGTLADHHGPIFSINIGTVKTVVISNWEMAKECFTTNDVAVSYRPYLVACQNMTYNLAMLGFAPYGQFWRDMRKNVAFVFLADHRIDALSHVRISEVRTSAKELYHKWKRGKTEKDFFTVDMTQWLKEVAFNVVLRMVAGKRYFGEEAVVEVEEARICLATFKEYMRLFGVFTIGDAVPWLRRFDFGGHEKAMRENFKQLDAVVGEWLEEHKRKRKLDGEKGEKGGDFMESMLLEFDGTNIHGFDSDTIIKATAMALILGGTDTSSASNIWTLSLLLNNPGTLKKVMEEIDTHIGKERLVTESDTNKLVYLHAVVKESLRLYPPTPLNAPREFREDCKLGEYHVKKGTRLITNLWKIQTDPKIWPEPLEFKPERFLTTHKDVDVKGKHFELIPFGSGRRICPGVTFGLRTSYLTLANFLHCFHVSKPSTEPIDMTSAVELTNVKVTPLQVLIKPRLAPSLYESM